MIPVAMGASMVAMELAARAGGVADTTRPAWLLALGTGLLHLIGLALVHVLVRAHERSWREAFGFFGPGWRRHWLLAALLTGPALLVAWSLHHGSSWVLERLHLTPEPQTAVEAVRLASRAWERVLLFGFAVLTAPVLEELLFRGILWPMARDRGYRWIGAIAVSALFALIHLNTAAFLSIWFLGLFWTWLYEVSGDLTAPILSHALFNATNVIWLILVEGRP